MSDDLQHSSTSLIDSYLEKLNWQIKENANMGFSLQGLRNHICGETTKKYWHDKIYTHKINAAHLNGDFHLHDLGELDSYCCGWDLQDLLRLGFTGVEGKISCKPARHFGSALGQIVNFIFTLQGETAGAQAFSNFDTLLAPFIRLDKLDYKQVKQELQSFVFNLNVPTRVGFQTPFFNITMDLNVPSYLADQAVTVGGELITQTYSEFQPEMDILNQAFAEVMLEGDGQERIFTFPIPTYNIGKDFNWDDSRFDKIWEMSSRYGIPYFANYINSDMDPEDARSMCCRLRLDNRELRKRGGGLFGSNPLTGSIGVVTLNLPRLGYLASLETGGNVLDKLFLEIDELMNLAKESLEIKRNVIEGYTQHGLYPYTRFYLSQIFKKTGKYWANHFSTIGLIGMNELLLNLIGEDITTTKGSNLARKILEHMRSKIIEYQEETGNLYNLEATPAEGTSYRLAKIDQKRFGNTIIFANSEQVLEGGDPYYTNSSQLPVGYTQDIFEAADLQNDLQAMYTGGTVFHSFLGERLSSGQMAKTLIHKLTTNYKLPYITLTPTFSICKNHGYLDGEQSHCPKCNSRCEVYSRVVGYIRPVDQWNLGKQAEYKDRTEFITEKNKVKVEI